MFKKILPTLLAIAVALLVSACGPEASPTDSSTTAAPTVTSQTSPTVTTAPATTPTISREQAKAIALQHAGLTDATVRRIEIELDRERGVTVYEVEFDHGGYDYDYNIHAETGEILQSKKERDD